MALADKVKELRQKLGWKQVTLAKESGIPQATICRIESGNVAQPRMGQLQKLAGALGATIDYLAGDSIQGKEQGMKRALGGGNNRHVIIGIVSQALEMDKFKTILVERKTYGWLVWATDEKVEEREPALKGETWEREQ